MTVTDIELLQPHDRLAYVREHEADLEGLTVRELERVGTLLCHAAPPELRRMYPIDNDINPSEQQRFTQALFGDEDTPGKYETLGAAFGVETRKDDD